MVRDPLLAEDLAQDALEAGLRAPQDRLRHPRAWLAGALRNLFRQEMRRRRVRRELGSQDLPEAEAPPSSLERLEIQRVVGEAIAQLPEADRDLLVHHFYEERSIRALATDLGIGRNAVSYRLTQAKRSLRIALRDRLGPQWAILFFPLAAPRSLVPALSIRLAGTTAAQAAALVLVLPLTIVGTWLSCSTPPGAQPPHARMVEATPGETTDPAPSLPTSVAREDGDVAAPTDPTDQEPQISHGERLKRAYIYTAGDRVVSQRILEEALVAEAQRRRDLDLFVGEAVLQEEIDLAVGQRLEELRAAMPDSTVEETLAGLGFTLATYRAEVESMLRIDKMYLPEDPVDWSVEELKVLLSSRFGSMWDRRLKPHWEEMVAAQAAGEPIPLLDEQTRWQFILPTIAEGIRSRCIVRYPSHGLREGVALDVDGREVATDELLAAVAPLLGPVQREVAEMWVEVTVLAEQELRGGGNWLPLKETAQRYAREVASFETTIIPHQDFVLSEFGFRSMELYRQYFRIRESFLDSVPDRLTEEALQEHRAARGQFLMGGKAKASIILCGVGTMKTGRPRVSGDPFGEAFEAAWEVGETLQTLEEEQERAGSGAGERDPYIEVLLAHSDYPPAEEGAPEEAPHPSRGRFPPLRRPMLSQFLGESDFTAIVYGRSIADELFFGMQPGEVRGPVKGPLGAYFYRLEEREGGFELPQDAEHDAIVRDDLLRTLMLEYLYGLR